MRTIELYRKHKAGEVSREKFLYEVRRDKNLPWVTNITSYDDAVKILKNKGVISEAEISENYEVHYTNQNVKAAKKFNNKQKAIEFAKELVNNKAKEVVVFNAGPNFNSTADTDAVVQWWGDGSFMDNKSKNNPDLAAKKMSLGEDEIDEISAQTKYNAAMKAVDRGWSSRDSDSKYKKAISQGNKFIEEIDPVLKKTVEDFGRSLGFETKIEKGTTGFQYEPIVQILMGNDLRNPEIRVVIKKDTDNIEGGQYLPDEAAERRLGNLIKQIQKKELDVELGSGSLNEVDNNIPTDPAVDRVNPYFLKRGVEMLLAKEKELTNDSYIKALNKAASMLEKNPHAFDEEMFANAKDVEKADAKLETEEVKKANHKNKANEMKKVKVKSLKESAIEELTTHLKKKELVNEDSHWKHNVGSEVHTPDGPGKVIEIVGGTFTVEMEDGTHKDFQFNTVDHFTQKAAEEEPSQGAQDEPSLSGMWKKWDQDVASGKYPDMNQQYGQELRYKPEDIQTLLAKLKEYISKNKDDKEKMVKIKEAVKKLKEAGEKTALVTTASGQTTAVDYKTDDELKSIGDNTDVRKVQTGMGKKVKG